ncbi:arrestin domain-containing protein 17-like [Colletes gigas]|uniref:arrestin domain-containing protein 17-like n=1 Tax=Colletes gigas TaxID=935657 RepID=UPI001C9B87F0|nr:arrestin domain-containing protein 17-like [Colletes gigas]
MMSLKTFRVVLDRSRATYVGGETVAGKIILGNAKEKSIKGMYLVANGEARVRWTETDTDLDNNSCDNTYTNSENYFKFKFTILKATNDNTRVQIPAGYHEYPFEFQLPHNIPTSFEHIYGHIRYTVKAAIDRPWKFNHECKIAFTVISNLDLNAYQDKCLGIDDEGRKNFYRCCCISTGSLNVRLKVPSSGYVPGESLVATINYTNLSNSVAITGITTKLEQELKFHAISAKTKHEYSEISSVKYTGPFSNIGLISLDLRIPPIPPSNLEYCRIINLNYKLKVFVHVSGAHFKFVRSYPLLIGSIPLNYSPDKTNTESGTEKELSRNVPKPMSIGLRQRLPSSYEECVLGAENIKDHDESKYVLGADAPFSPRYPVFDYKET